MMLKLADAAQAKNTDPSDIDQVILGRKRR